MRRPASHPCLPVLLLAACVLAFAASAARAVVVSGAVLGESGAPVANVNLDFVDSTGTSIPLVGDTTDLLGLYSISVPVGTYAIYYKAPFGSGWAHRRINGVVISTNVTRPDVILPYGYIVDGFVTDSVGVPILDVDLDFNDCATGEQWLTLSDNTDITGYYSVVVPIGNWSISYDPLPGDTHVGVVVPCVPISGITTRPTVILQDGLLVSARVIDSRGGAVFDANTSWADSAGMSVHTSNDRTDATGVFAVRVVTDSYTIQVTPPVGSRLVGTDVSTGAVTADTVLPDIVLLDGFTVDGLIVTAGGVPIPGIDTDWNLPGGPVSSGLDDSDATGRYSVVIPAGTYGIDFDPPVGSRYAAESRPGVVINADTTLSDTVLDAAWFITGRVVDASLVPVNDVDTASVETTTGIPQRTILDHSDALGEFLIVLPDGTYDITFTPPVAPGLPSKTLQGVVVSGADVRLPDVVLDSPPPPPDPALILVTRQGADVVLTWAESPGATRVVSASTQANVFGPAEILDANVTTLTYSHGGEIGSGRLLFYLVR